MGQTGSCRSCSCCKSSPSLVEPTRLGVAISPGRRRPLRGRGVEDGRGQRGGGTTRPGNSARPTATHSKGVGMVVIVQVCETQIQTAAGRHLQLCTSCPLVDFGFCIRPTVGGTRCRTCPRVSCIGKSMLGLLRPARSRLTGYPKGQGRPAGRSKHQTTHAKGHLRGARRNPPHLARSRVRAPCQVDDSTSALVRHRQRTAEQRAV